MKDFEGKYHKQFNYIVSNYEFRFNVVTAHYEFRRLVKGKPSKTGLWKKYDDREKNNILIEMFDKDLDIAQDKFNLFIESAIVSPDYNPFLEYFERLKRWDGKIDYLAQICKTIKTDDNQRFESVMKKFMVGVLDCLLEEDAVNDVCLVFQSSQGVGKTRWMRQLLPEQFRSEYLYEGNVDTRNNDHIQYLSMYWFIHLDELEVLKGNEIGAIKSYITRQRISTRKAYGRYRSNFVRRASFLGSVNDDKFLTDITGARRWLVFTVKSIDYMHNVDIDGLWSQIYHYWQEGFQHWFDVEEIKAINKINEEYRSMSSEEEQLLQLFTFPHEPHQGQWLSSSDVIVQLSTARALMTTKMQSNRMGKALVKYAKSKKVVNGVTRYLVKFEGEDKNLKDQELPDDSKVDFDFKKHDDAQPAPAKEIEPIQNQFDYDDDDDMPF